MSTPATAETKETETKPKIIPAEIRNRAQSGEAPPEKKEETVVEKKTEAVAAVAAAPAAAETEVTPGKVTKKKKGEPVPEIPNAAAPDLTAQVKQIIADQGKSPAATAATLTLSQEDERELELARFAAEKHADKYSDLPARVTTWYAARDKFLAEKAKEHGGKNSQEFRDFLESEELRDFVKENRPSYQRGDREGIREELIEDRGARRARKEIEPEIDAIKMRQREIEAAPIIQQTLADVARAILTDSSEQKDEALVEFSKDPVAFSQTNKREARIVAETALEYKERAEETLRITNRLVKVGAVLTPRQKWVSEFVGDRESELERTAPNGMRMDDGKILVSAGQMAKLKAANAPLQGYRQFTPNEIVGMIAAEGQAEIKKKLNKERQELEDSGFVRRQPATADVTKPANSEQARSPMSTSSTAPGAAGVKPAKTEPWHAQYSRG